MRIICLQLTRLGDIYQSIPTIRGLLRVYPDAKLDLIVRDSFAKGIPNLGERVRIFELPVSDLLQPFLKEHATPEASLSHLNQWIESIKAEPVDLLVNLSFSPLSSFLTFELASENTVVRGYSRTTDGFLDIKDESSAYVYAQVGVGRPNRIHISDIFSMVAGVDLIDSDYARFQENTNDDLVALFSEHQVNKPFVVFHVGASSPLKTLSTEQWRQLALRTVDELKVNVVLVGSKSEAITQSGVLREGLIDLCGKTDLNQLRKIISQAKMLVGGDSLGVQIASCVGVPTINISTLSVNFWETGPRATGSYTLWYPNLREVPLPHILLCIEGVQKNSKPALPYIQLEPGFGMIYSIHGYEIDSWEWDLVRAIYSGKDFPRIERHLVLEGFSRLQELADLGLEQIELIKTGKNVSVPLSVLNEIDDLVLRVLGFCPEIAPVVRWFQTEKSMIAPGSREQVIENTEKVFKSLKEFCVTMKVNNSIGHQLGENTSWK